jgi:hypothetical protein
MLSQEAATVISNSVFRNNTSAGYGGAVALYGAKSVTISGSKITGNRAADSGGGLFIRGYNTTTANQVSIKGSKLGSNTAGIDGGGLYVSKGMALTLSGVSVQNNLAANAGGGLAALPGSGNTIDLKITGGDFTGNRTPVNSGAAGGGLYANGDGSATITGTKFNHNAAGTIAGGLGLRKSGDVTLTNVTATSNYAEDGAGIWLDALGATFQIKGGSLTRNDALFFGGGLEIVGSGAGTVGSHITGNFAASGGGIYCTDSNAKLAPGTVVTGNAAFSNPNTFGI